MKKIKAIALLLCAVMMITCGCDMGKKAEEPKPKTFTKSGMSIELTEAFVEKEHVSYTSCYSSKDLAVFTLKEDFSLFGGNKYTLKEYAALVITNNKITATVMEKDGLTYFTFLNNVSGKDMTYYAFVYEASNAFWLIQFACMTGDVDKMEPVIFDYAKTVKV